MAMYCDGKSVWHDRHATYHSILLMHLFNTFGYGMSRQWLNDIVYEYTLCATIEIRFHCIEAPNSLFVFTNNKKKYCKIE